MGVNFISFGASLEGFFMLLKLFLEAFDALGGSGLFTVEVIFSSLDCDTQRFAYTLKGD